MKYMLTVMLMLISSVSFATDYDLRQSKIGSTWYITLRVDGNVEQIIPSRVENGLLQQHRLLLEREFEDGDTVTLTRRGTTETITFRTDTRTDVSTIETDTQTVTINEHQTTGGFVNQYGTTPSGTTETTETSYTVEVTDPVDEEHNGEITEVTIDNDGNVRVVLEGVTSSDPTDEETETINGIQVTIIMPLQEDPKDYPQQSSQSTKNYGGKANELINELRTAGIGGEWDISVDLSDRLNLSTSGRYEDGEGIMGSRILFTYKLLEF